MGKNFLQRLFCRGRDGAEDEGGQTWDVEDRKADEFVAAGAGVDTPHLGTTSSELQGEFEHDSDRPSDPAP
jgi:hypothetical protein